MKKLILCMALIAPLIGWTKQCESDYPPATLVKEIVPYIHPSVHFVEPPYAGFDPCNGTVDLKINEKSDSFVVIMHGGGGMDNAQTNVGRRFQKAGYSTLMFDAFKMNKINMDPMFWVMSVNAGSMGRMLYFSNLSAIKWLTKNYPDRTKNIILYGVSTGASAAISLAATEGIDNLKIVIAEAPNNAGIGFPDKLLKPVHVFYGNLDNFGGSREDEYLWQRRSSCLWNAPNYNMPTGNTSNCNYWRLTRGQRGQTVEEWINEQKEKKAEIRFQLIDGAAHGIFNGRDINSQIQTSRSGVRIYITTGSKPGVADKLFDEILSIIK